MKRSPNRYRRTRKRDKIPQKAESAVAKVDIKVISAGLTQNQYL